MRFADGLAGRPTSVPLDYGCIAARVPLDDAVRSRLPALLDGGPGLAQGPGGLGMFLPVQDPASRATVDPTTCRIGLPALAAWHRLRESAVGSGRTATALTSTVRVVA